MRQLSFSTVISKLKDCLSITEHLLPLIRNMSDNASETVHNTDIHCEPKNTPKCFCYIFHKTQSILIKFGTHCPE